MLQLAHPRLNQQTTTEGPFGPRGIFPPRREVATRGETKGGTATMEDFQVIAKLRESEEG
jgi:hypothetical protein